MTTTTPLLEFRELRSEDEPQVLELLTTTMAGGPTGNRSSDFFAWKHRDNPFGASPGLVAEHEGRVVGVRLFLRWQLTAGDRLVHAVRAVDTATHPDYQRMGIFRRLTMDLLERVEGEDGVSLVFNTPNASSRPGYLKLGWQPVGQLAVHISPVHPFSFARGMLQARRANASGAASAVAQTSDDRPGPRRCRLPKAAVAFEDQAAVTALLGERSRSGHLQTPLTLGYLRWRYADAPGLDYRCVMVRRGDEIVGLGFGRLRRRARLSEFTLGDVIVRDGDMESARRVLRAARRCGADHVAVHASPGTELASQVGRAGYMRVPNHGIGLVANPRAAAPTGVLDPSSWRLSLGDLEVF